MITVPEEIKKILHQDNSQSNIRIHFPNGERTDICNDLIVMNSVTFKESLCSQNEFKFGLVESPIFECEVVGVSNIVGATVEITCEVFCPASVDGAVWQNDIQQYVYPIKYGTFVVQSAERQTDLLHRKIVCYNSLIKTTGMGLNEYELWKQNIKHSGDATVYTPKLFYLLWSQTNGKASLFGKAMSSGSLKRLDVGGPRSARGVYEGQIVWFDIDFTYDVFHFGTPEYSYLPQYNNPIDYPAKFVFSGSNKKYFREYLDFCNEHGIIEALTWEEPRRSKSFYSENEVCAKKFNDVSDFVFYPYLSSYYDNSHHTRIEILTKIRFYVNDTLVYTVTAAGDTSGSKYYYTTLSNAEDLTYSIPIEYDEVNFGKRIVYSDFDMQSVMNAYMELNGAFGYLNRNAGLDIMNIKEKFNLVPSDTLYPGNALYPQKVTGGSILPQDYESCWYGDSYNTPYGMIIVKYKYTIVVDEEIQEVNAVYQTYINGFSISSNENSYLTYVLDNIILQHEYFQSSTIEAFTAKIAEVLPDIKYMPVKLVGRGLPYVEAGDTFEVLTPTNDSITTIVLSRTLKGEMVLQDEYTSVS